MTGTGRLEALRKLAAEMLRTEATLDQPYSPPSPDDLAGPTDLEGIRRDVDGLPPRSGQFTPAALPPTPTPMTPYRPAYTTQQLMDTLNARQGMMPGGYQGQGMGGRLFAHDAAEARAQAQAQAHDARQLQQYQDAGNPWTTQQLMDTLNARQGVVSNPPQGYGNTIGDRVMANVPVNGVNPPSGVGIGGQVMANVPVPTTSVPVSATQGMGHRAGLMEALSTTTTSPTTAPTSTAPTSTTVPGSPASASGGPFDNLGQTGAVLGAAGLGATALGATARGGLPQVPVRGGLTAGIQSRVPALANGRFGGAARGLATGARIGGGSAAFYAGQQLRGVDTGHEGINQNLRDPAAAGLSAGGLAAIAPVAAPVAASVGIGAAAGELIGKNLPGNEGKSLFNVWGNLTRNTPSTIPTSETLTHGISPEMLLGEVLSHDDPDNRLATILADRGVSGASFNGDKVDIKADSDAWKIINGFQGAMKSGNDPYITALQTIDGAEPEIRDAAMMALNDTLASYGGEIQIDRNGDGQLETIKVDDDTLPELLGDVAASVPLMAEQKRQADMAAQVQMRREMAFQAAVERMFGDLAAQTQASTDMVSGAYAQAGRPELAAGHQAATDRIHAAMQMSAMNLPRSLAIQDARAQQQNAAAIMANQALQAQINPQPQAADLEALLDQIGG